MAMLKLFVDSGYFIQKEVFPVTSDEYLKLIFERGYGAVKLLDERDIANFSGVVDSAIDHVIEQMRDLGCNEIIKRESFNGFLGNFGLAHLDQFWDLRIKAAEVMRRLVSVEDLVCSFEPAFYFDPNNFRRFKIKSCYPLPKRLLHQSQLQEWRCAIFLNGTDTPRQGGIVLQDARFHDELEKQSKYFYAVPAGTMIIWKVEYFRQSFHSLEYRDDRVGVICILPITFAPRVLVNKRQLTEREKAVANFRCSQQAVCRVQKTVYSTLSQFYYRFVLSELVYNSHSIDAHFNEKPPTERISHLDDHLFYWFKSNSKIVALVAGNHVRKPLKNKKTKLRFDFKMFFRKICFSCTNQISFVFNETFCFVTEN